MSDALDRDAPGLSALAEPVRRALYRFVARSPEPVSREQAAEGTELAAHTAKFHLDKLVEEGLLEVEFRRLTGRTGPGAGRPAKLYRRAARQFSVSVPARDYALIGQILAEAVEAAAATGGPVREVAAVVARRHGEIIGQESAGEAGENALAQLAGVLETTGYEPRFDEGGRLLLENCPFDRMAEQHTELVCGLNLDFVEGVIEGLGCAGVRACLDPAPGRCCVSAGSRNE